MNGVILGNVSDLTDIQTDNFGETAVRAGYTEYYSDCLCMIFRKPKTKKMVYISKLTGNVTGLLGEA